MTEQWKKDRKKFEQELPSRFLSLTCVVIALIHFGKSEWKADWVLFAFVVLCFAPWMGYVFDSIGGEKWGAKYRKTEQGETSVPDVQLAPPAQPPPPAGVAIAAGAQQVQLVMPVLQRNQFTYESMKVLATLWKYQKKNFPGSKVNRWTFSVGQASPDYVDFSRGFTHLVSKGFADLAPNNGQVMLTEAGLGFCLENDANISKWDDVFDNFSN